MTKLKIKNLVNNKSLKLGEILKQFYQPAPLQCHPIRHKIQCKLQVG